MASSANHAVSAKAGSGIQSTWMCRDRAVQMTGMGPAQTPPLQMSPVVQALPSVQGLVFGVWTQPPFGSRGSAFRLQLSSVHTLPSSHAVPSDEFVQSVVVASWLGDDASTVRANASSRSAQARGAGFLTATSSLSLDIRGKVNGINP